MKQRSNHNSDHFFEIYGKNWSKSVQNLFLDSNTAQISPKSHKSVLFWSHKTQKLVFCGDGFHKTQKHVFCGGNPNVGPLNVGPNVGPGIFTFYKRTYDGQRRSVHVDLYEGK